jgi:nicotinamide riboside kinase
MKRAFVVAILGAESTGKTTLVQELADVLPARAVTEYLREFCDAARRTPHAHEQADIAAEQMRRIEAAAAEGGLVVADTSALQTAVYSDLVFGDTSLYDAALAAHADRVDFTLLTALDLPWEADGLQRDGPQVRVPVDTRIRAALHRGGIAHAIVAGEGAARLDAARAAILRRRAGRDLSGPRWRWVCARCGEPECERHALARPPSG